MYVEGAVSSDEAHWRSLVGSLTFKRSGIKVLIIMLGKKDGRKRLLSPILTKMGCRFLPIM